MNTVNDCHLGKWRMRASPLERRGCMESEWGHGYSRPDNQIVKGIRYVWPCISISRSLVGFFTDDLIQPWSATLRQIIFWTSFCTKCLVGDFHMVHGAWWVPTQDCPVWVLQPWYWYWLKIVLSFILTVIADTSYHVARWVSTLRKSCGCSYKYRLTPNICVL